MDLRQSILDIHERASHCEVMLHPWLHLLFPHRLKSVHLWKVVWLFLKSLPLPILVYPVEASHGLVLVSCTIEVPVYEFASRDSSLEVEARCLAELTAYSWEVVYILCNLYLPYRSCRCRMSPLTLFIQDFEVLARLVLLRFLIENLAHIDKPVWWTAIKRNLRLSCVL